MCSLPSVSQRGQMNCSKRVGLLLASFLSLMWDVKGWTPSSIRMVGIRPRFDVSVPNLIGILPSSAAPKSNTAIYSSQLNSQEAHTGETTFSSEELGSIASIFDECQATNDPDALRSKLLSILPTLSPALLLKLRQAESNPNETIQTVSKYVNTVLEQQLDVAKTTLSEMLNAGEIRKLDGLIGKASRDGRLDTAFFNVLTLNLKDAMESDETTEEGVASRHQILTHIYTRCQEEAEKSIPPGTALLNKLLRTQQASIRKNLYEHYLTPQPSTITAPDGSKVELGEKPVLVTLDQFSSAIDGAVLQIRNVETAGGFDRESAAMMVESCRQVAKEARIVIGESYGTGSTELRQWEDALEPVFRPKSPSSPYIKGEFET